jgi:hypothetical protein
MRQEVYLARFERFCFWSRLRGRDFKLILQLGFREMVISENEDSSPPNWFCGAWPIILLEYPVANLLLRNRVD